MMTPFKLPLARSVLFGILALGACSQSPQEQLINQIEAQISLPDGAKSKNKYARYYAFGPGGRIIGEYIIQSPDIFVHTLEACREQAFRDFPCGKDGNTVELVRNGERLWIEDYLSLPTRFGGGCSAISFQYDPASERFYHLECKGPY